MHSLVLFLSTHAIRSHDFFTLKFYLQHYVYAASSPLPNSPCVGQLRKLSVNSAVLILAVEFPPAVVENLRSEELRQSAINRDPKLKAKLQTLHRELRPKQHKPDQCQHRRAKSNGHLVVADTQPAENDASDEPTDKFDTIRRIRRGNTKRRVDAFEAL